MRARLLITATVLVVFSAASASAGVLIEPTLILGGPEYQLYANANGTYLGWTQNSTGRPGAFHAFVSNDSGQTKTRIDPAGTQGWFGDIGADSNEAVYQQTDGAVSDLYLVDDVSDPSVQTALVVPNTTKWEWQPRLSDEFVMFTRNYERLDVYRMFLYDRATNDLTLLREVPFRNSLFAGDIGSLYATWTICRRSCAAWIYTIGTQELTKIPMATGRNQYAPVVDEVHGNAYWVRSGDRCGQNVGIWTAPLDSLSTPARIGALPRGIDTEWKASLEFDTVNGRVDFIFPRYNCRTGDANIYELQGVDTLP
jgi:hypothetical protein